MHFCGGISQCLNLEARQLLFNAVSMVFEQRQHQVFLQVLETAAVFCFAFGCCGLADIVQLSSVHVVDVETKLVRARYRLRTVRESVKASRKILGRVCGWCSLAADSFHENCVARSGVRLASDERSDVYVIVRRDRARVLDVKLKCERVVAFFKATGEWRNCASAELLMDGVCGAGCASGSSGRLWLERIPCECASVRGSASGGMR